jgi:hypothetical protein
MAQKATDLKRQVLLAALDCSDGDSERTFTFEELLVRAWERDPLPWGLRGFERQYPDSERIHRELDSRGQGSKGLVALGLLEKVQARVYRLTPKGLAAASELTPEDVAVRERVERKLETEVRRILEHPVFKDWLRDSTKPSQFREACHFWGVAPGTPPRVIGDRIQKVEQTLGAALDVLNRRGVDEVGEPRGALLYDRRDIERCREFQESLTRRFAKDLRALGVKIAP